MKFNPALEQTTLIKRYKRFLADVKHPQLGEITVHCPNTGSMKNCWKSGWKAWIQNSQNPKRKYLFTWTLVENDSGHMIGINTQFANEIVFEAISKNQIKEFSDVESIQREVKYGVENSRIDLLLTDSNQLKTYIEVKSVTLLDDADVKKGIGYFPDAKTTRGQKHIRELIDCVLSGNRAVLFFLVQHTGVNSVSAASHIDPDYAALLSEAVKVGVEVLVYNCKINQREITLDRALPFI